MSEGLVIVALAVLQLTVQHGRCHPEDVPAGVVEYGARLRHPLDGGGELPAVLLSFADAAASRASHPFGVTDHRRAHAVQLRVGGQLRVDDVRPATEPDQRVHLHRREPLQPVRHRRDLHPEQFLRNRRRELVRGLQGGPRVAQEHRAVELEVVVVRSVQGVEVHRARARTELLVGGDRGGVGGHHAPVVAAQHVEMGRHMPQMARIRHQVAQPLPGPQRVLGSGGHLHQVDIHVQDPGMRPASVAGQRPFQYLLGLDRGRPFGRLPGRLVPQRPRREVHQRVGEQRRDVEVIWMGAADGAHGIGVPGIPG